MVAVRFGQAGIVRGLVGGGDQNTPYQFDSRTRPTTTRQCKCYIDFKLEVVSGAGH